MSTFAMLQIRLLDGFQLLLDEQPLPPLPSHTARSLFAFLVCHATQTHSRARLAGLFYPNLPEARARRRLSQALWQICSTLANAGLAAVPIVTAGDMVRWDETVTHTVDVNHFEQEIARAKQSNGSPSLTQAPSVSGWLFGRKRHGPKLRLEP